MTICGCQKLVNIVRIFISSFIVLQEMPFGGGFPEANWTPKRSGVLPDGREWCVDSGVITSIDMLSFARQVAMAMVS